MSDEIEEATDEEVEAAKARARLLVRGESRRIGVIRELIQRMEPSVASEEALTLEDMSAASIAISLKRIADSLDQIAMLMDPDFREVETHGNDTE